MPIAEHDEDEYDVEAQLAAPMSELPEEAAAAPYESGDEMEGIESPASQLPQPETPQDHTPEVHFGDCRSFYLSYTRC